MPISPLAADAASASQASSQASGARTRLSDNYDTFLVLLTAQLQNQDPMAPMDSTQFTQQLVQFSQVEQQIRTNEQLEGLAGKYQAAAAGAALSYLGRETVLESDKTTLANGRAQWGYTFGQNVNDVTLTILDARGHALLETNGEPLAGTHVFNWDGRDRNGNVMPAGVYRLMVSAKNETGEDVKATMSVREAIRGVDFSGTTPLVITDTGTREIGLIRAVLDG